MGENNALDVCFESIPAACLCFKSSVGAGSGVLDAGDPPPGRAFIGTGDLTVDLDPVEVTRARFADAIGVLGAVW